MDNTMTTVRTTRSNPLAIVSLVCRIAGMTFFPWLGSIIGIFTGSITRREITTNAGAEEGEGLAKAGVILGWIGFGLHLALVLLGLLFFFPFAMVNW